ncbi:MAG: pilus assembly protein PilM [Gammaproteobacteria bacterium]
MISLQSLSRRTRTSIIWKEVGLIGVDFSIDNINLVQLGVMVDGDVGLKSCCSIKYQDTREELLSSPKNLRPIIRQAIKEHRFKGKSIVSSMPSSDVRIYSINYTKSKNSDDSELILQALQSRIDEDLSQYVIDYLPVRSDDKYGEQLALVAIVKQELVISYLELLRNSGLHVDALEIRPAAINRLVYSIYQKQDYQNVLVVNFGNDNSYLTVTSGRRLLFDNQITFGVKTLIDKMSNVLEMTPNATLDLLYKHGFEITKHSNTPKSEFVNEDVTKTLLDIAKPIFSELIDEINRILIFAASENHGEPIKNIFLLGSLAHVRGIDHHLDKQLNITVQSLSDPLGTFRQSYSHEMFEEDCTPDMAIATGLALKGLVENE